VLSSISTDILKTSKRQAIHKQVRKHNMSAFAGLFALSCLPCAIGVTSRRRVTFANDLVNPESSGQIRNTPGSPGQSRSATGNFLSHRPTAASQQSEGENAFKDLKRKFENLTDVLLKIYDDLVQNLSEEDRENVAELKTVCEKYRHIFQNGSLQQFTPKFMESAINGIEQLRSSEELQTAEKKEMPLEDRLDGFGIIYTVWAEFVSAAQEKIDPTKAERMQAEEVFGTVQERSKFREDFKKRFTLLSAYDDLHSSKSEREKDARAQEERDAILLNAMRNEMEKLEKRDLPDKVLEFLKQDPIIVHVAQLLAGPKRNESIDFWIVHVAQLLTSPKRNEWIDLFQRVMARGSDTPKTRSGK